jgi:hypothetical protein
LASLRQRPEPGEGAFDDPAASRDISTPSTRPTLPRPTSATSR